MDARELTMALGGRWYRRYGTAACPVCQLERKKSQTALTLADGDAGLLLHCKRAGCEFRDILAAAGVVPGEYTQPDPNTSIQRRAEELAEAEKRERQALALWNEAQLITGTLAETYLRARGITCALPETLRFHPGCWHPTAKRFPAMLARVDGAKRFAVHRTYLRGDGSGKANVTPDKAMLGSVSGGAVRLTEAQGALVVAEGIETALSLGCGLLCAPASIWAALSTSGIRGAHLPDDPGRLIIATDSDDKGAGKAAGIALAERADALGWQVSLLPAPDGRDWNDVLTMKGECV